MANFYNLSSQNSLNCNKELIFVKLTDSALRAIEEYQKNQSKYGSSCNASIQFVGNEGFLSFPTSGSNSNNNNSNQPVEQKFSFSLSDIDQQGSFECLQQNHNQMNILGAPHYKMRIHAKEDVYESTKDSMAKINEIKREKCTREIKPNQTDIGRVKKVKSTASSSSLYNRTPITTTSTTTPNSLNTSSSKSNNNITTNHHRLQSVGGGGNNGGGYKNVNINDDNERSPSGGGGTGNGTSSVNDSHSNTNSQSAIPINSSSNGNSSLNMQYNNNLLNDFDQQHHYHPSNNHHHAALNGVVVPPQDDNDRTNHIHSNHSNNNNNNNNNRNGGNHRNPDIMKKSIRERLIHLLALRPFKKPELYARLTSEGIKDRDRSVIINVLKSISYIRDNAYVLNRHIWNDVHEDWPFYTEQDRSTLKRRKPQNLTPPLSSDGGSSTSGQSPNSQHNGSPPPPVKRPSSSAGGMKGGNSNMNNDKYTEPTAKKQRISHYKKDAVGGGGSNSNNNSSQMDMLPTPAMRGSSNNNSSSVGLYDNPREPSYMNSSSRSRDADDYYGSNVTPNAHESEDSGMSLSYAVINNEVATKRSASLPPSQPNGNNNGGGGNSNSSQRNGNESGSRNRNSNSRNNTSNNNNNNTTTTTINNNNNINNSNNNNNNGNNNSNINTTSSSYDNNSNSNADMDGFRESPTIGSGSQNFGDYTRITSVEQRRRYKTEFDNDFAEYRQLFTVIDRVKQRFAQLEEELRNVRDNQQYRDIKSQIILEYNENNNNNSFQDKKQRFNFLHHKLSHIKRLVSEFDTTLTNGNGDDANANY